MLKKIRRLLFGKYITWDNYKKGIDFLDELNFQQKIRRENIRNL